MDGRPTPLTQGEIFALTIPFTIFHQPQLTFSQHLEAHIELTLISPFSGQPKPKAVGSDNSQAQLTVFVNCSSQHGQLTNPLARR
jgi:hypothetical protein